MLTASDGAVCERLGWSVSISGDTIVAGANGDTISMKDDQGSAYVFVKPVEGWAYVSEVAQLTATDIEAGDFIGHSAVLAGGTVVFGAYGDSSGANSQQCSAYLFVKPDGSWVNTSQNAKLTAPDGIGWYCIIVLIPMRFCEVVKVY